MMRSVDNVVRQPAPSDTGHWRSGATRQGGQSANAPNLVPVGTESSSCQDSVDFLEKAQESRPPPLPHVTDETPVPKASENSGEQPQQRAGADLNGNTLVPESPELLAQEIARWKQKEEKKARLGEANARREQDLEAEVGQVESLAEHLLRFCPVPGLPGGRGGDGDIDLSCHPPVHGPEGDLKGVRGDADFNVSLPGPELEPQGTARQPREEKQRIARLVGQQPVCRGKRWLCRA